MFVVALIVCVAAGLSLLVRQALMRRFAGGAHAGGAAGVAAMGGLRAGEAHSPAGKLGAVRASFGKLAVLLERIAPIDGEGTAKLQAKLDRCGMQLSSHTWRGLCVLVMFLGGVIFLYMSIAAKSSAAAVVIFVALGAACGKLAMELYLAYKEKRHCSSVEEALPDTLDILAIAVSSGLTLEDGFIEAAESLDPKSALGHEFARMNWEVNFCDTPRVKALEGFMTRVDCPSVNDFCTSTIQAIESGGSLARNLAIQAQTARDIKFDKMREKIAKLDTKMTIPLGLFFMPATGVLILAPVMFSAVSQGMALLGS